MPNDSTATLATRMQQGGAVATKPREQSVRELLARMKQEFAHVLPRHVSPERLARLAMTKMRRNPRLFECSDQSLAGAIMEAAQLGLDFSVPNEAHLVPYYNKKLGGFECQFQQGYKGMVKLARQAAEFMGTPLATLYARPIHANDVYDRNYGTDQYLRHRTTKFGDDPGPLVGVYAYCKFRHGGEVFDDMTLAQLDEHRGRFAKTSQFWDSDFEQMACKTVLKRLIWRYLDMSSVQAEAFSRDNARESGEPAPSGPILELQPEEFLAVEMPVPTTPPRDLRADPDDTPVHAPRTGTVMMGGGSYGPDDIPAYDPVTGEVPADDIPEATAEPFDKETSAKLDLAQALGDMAKVGTGKVAEQRRKMILGVTLGAADDIGGNEVMLNFSPQQLAEALPIAEHLVGILPDILKEAKTDGDIRQALRAAKGRRLKKEA